MLTTLERAEGVVEKKDRYVIVIKERLADSLPLDDIDGNSTYCYWRNSSRFAKGIAQQ